MKREIRGRLTHALFILGRFQTIRFFRVQCFSIFGTRGSPHQLATTWCDLRSQLLWHLRQVHHKRHNKDRYPWYLFWQSFVLETKDAKEGSSCFRNYIKWPKWTSFSSFMFLYFKLLQHFAILISYRFCLILHKTHWRQYYHVQTYLSYVLL